MEKSKFTNILGKLSKKGFYEILLFVGDKKQVHYSEVLAYATKSNLVRSDATVTRALSTFTGLGILRRKVSQDTPIRTTYELTKTGKDLVKHLREMQSL